jgi:hypothetical protein
MPLAQKDFDTEQEFLVYCAARSIYQKKNKKTPSGKYTWGKWFEIKFGLNYLEYIDVISNRARQRSSSAKRGRSD